MAKRNIETELRGVKITPVLLGADLNCYNVARAFHEAYGVRSYAFGRYKVGNTEYCRIVKFRAVPDIDDPEVMLNTLEEFAGRHAGEKLILMGCTDDYATLIIKYQKRLGEHYIISCPDEALTEDITLKARFYEYCEHYDIPYPRTVVLSKGDAVDTADFSYPIIIKPSSSVLYWKHPFDGMQKVYRAHSQREAESIVSAIYASGYPDKIIVQDTIPGDDSQMYTLTAYCGSDGKARMLCLGHVLLEEHTPKGMGNHAAILTDYNRPLMEKLKKFLEDIGYRGFANFDIKLDSRDGEFKLFEINVRQGRSNYYLTASGCNPARLIVEDKLLGRSGECVFCKEKAYWSYLPLKLVLRYASVSEREQIFRCRAEGKAFSSMHYRPDTFFNPLRVFYVAIQERHQIKKFERYYPVSGVERYNK